MERIQIPMIFIIYFILFIFICTTETADSCTTETADGKDSNTNDIYYLFYFIYLYFRLNKRP